MKQGKFFVKVTRSLLIIAVAAIMTACGNHVADDGSVPASSEEREGQAEKQTLTLGCIALEATMQEAVVAFNKQSEDYTIEVKDYAPSIVWTDEGAWDSYLDAQTKLTLDVMAGRAPDMFVVKDVNLDVFAKKGVIENLNPYLEKSTVVSRESLFGSVLNAYTKNDILVAIPFHFTVTTPVGRKSELGEDCGWTLDEMIAYAEQYPDADIFSRMNWSTILQYCIMADIDSYVDYESGDCYFDTPEFKRVLEFAAGYRDVIDFTKSEDESLKNHEALLTVQTMGSPEAWQISEMKFQEPIHAIGFPTKQSNGILVDGGDGICISAHSAHQEAAWAFVEFMLSEEQQTDFFNRQGDYVAVQFPMRRSVYETMMEEAMTPNYLYDMEGNILVDEEGPMERPKVTVGYGSNVYEVYALTEEQVNGISKMIDSVDGLRGSDGQLMKIIFEEAAPYFDGKKNVDEVMDIIQNRALIYINENR